MLNKSILLCFAFCCVDLFEGSHYIFAIGDIEETFEQVASNEEDQNPLSKKQKRKTGSKTILRNIALGVSVPVATALSYAAWACTRQPSQSKGQQGLGTGGQAPSQTQGWQLPDEIGRRPVPQPFKPAAQPQPLVVPVPQPHSEVPVVLPAYQLQEPSQRKRVLLYGVGTPSPAQGYALMRLINSCGFEVECIHDFGAEDQNPIRSLRLSQDKLSYEPVKVELSCKKVDIIIPLLSFSTRLFDNVKTIKARYANYFNIKSACKVSDDNTFLIMLTNFSKPETMSELCSQSSIWWDVYKEFEVQGRHALIFNSENKFSDNAIQVPNVKKEMRRLGVFLGGVKFQGISSINFGTEKSPKFFALEDC